MAPQSLRRLVSRRTVAVASAVLMISAIAAPSASASSTYYAADGTLCTNAATATTLQRVAPYMKVGVLNVSPSCMGA